MLGPVQATPEKIENVHLIPRLRLPSTLILYENGPFRKTIFKPEKFENAGFAC